MHQAFNQNNPFWHLYLSNFLEMRKEEAVHGLVKNLGFDLQRAVINLVTKNNIRRRTCFSSSCSLVSVTVVPIYVRFSFFNFRMGVCHVLYAELCAVWKRISINLPQISFQNSRIKSESSNQPVHMKLFYPDQAFILIIWGHGNMAVDQCWHFCK